MRAKTIVKRALRFGTTGAFATGIHFVVAILVMNLVIPSQVFANGAAFVTATIFSYVVNTIWSFSAPLHGRSLIRYVIVACAGFGAALSISALAESLHVNYLIGIAMVICTVTPMNFSMHYLWTYRERASIPLC